MGWNPEQTEMLTLLQHDFEPIKETPGVRCHKAKLNFCVITQINLRGLIHERDSEPMSKWVNIMNHTLYRALIWFKFIFFWNNSDIVN